MKRVSRLLAVLLAALAVAAMTPYAAADVAFIETPLKDTFLSLYRDECVEVWATYVVTEECSAQKSPKNTKITMECLPGDKVCIAWQWHGWGLICSDRYEGKYLKKESLGWVEMSHLRKYFSFDDVDKSVYGEVVIDYGGPVKTDEGEYIYFYSFPGSGVLVDTAYAGEDLYYDSSWADPLGREWGYVGYYYTAKGWVCLDDMYSGEIGRIWPEYVDEELELPDAVVRDEQARLPVMVIVLVAAAVAVTAVLTILLIRKNNQSGSKGAEQ